MVAMKKSVVLVILVEDVPNLGKLGDIVSVRLGYARNFLIPLGKVKRATEENKREFELRRRDLERVCREKLEQAQKLAEEMGGLTIQITQKAGLDGRLFGSVSIFDIIAALRDHGFVLDKRKIVLNQPIKSVGDHELMIRLHQNVRFPITVSVLGQA